MNRSRVCIAGTLMEGNNKTCTGGRVIDNHACSVWVLHVPRTANGRDAQNLRRRANASFDRLNKFREPFPM